MRKIPALTMALVLCSIGLGRPAAAATASGGPYDGEWSVVLVCSDTHDKNGLVKGYTFNFRASIADGKLQGQYGAKDTPASLVLSGEVADDGTLELRAVGNTGQPDYTVGTVSRGSRYAYTMAGRLDPSHGQAVRRELRPCTATFDRL